MKETKLLFRTTILLILLNCCCIDLYAQWPSAFKIRDSLIANGIDYLHQQHIDTIAVYSYFGSLSVLPNCRSEQFPNYDPNKAMPCTWENNFLVFILWKKNDRSFFTFKCKCYNYPSEPLNDMGLWQYYEHNRKAIQTGQAKEPLLKHVNLETEEVTVGPEKLSYKETENFQLIFLTKKEQFTKNIGYRLYRQYSFDGDQNLNYDYNIKLPIKQLQLKLEKICLPMVFSKKLMVAQ